MSNQKKMILLGLFVAAGLLSLLMYGTGMNQLEQPGILSQSDVPEGEDFFERLEKREADLLGGTSSPAIAREGRRLTVTAASGEKIEFNDCIDCGPEKDVEHFFVERFHSPLSVLIYRQLYEGDDFVLVNAEGKSWTLPAYPIFSSDQKHFVLVPSSDSVSWNGLEIWEVSASELKKVYSYEALASETYQFLTWSTPTQIQLRYSGYDEGDAGPPVCRGVELRRENNQWNRKLRPEQIDGFCPPQEDWIPEYLRRPNPLLPE